MIMERKMEAVRVKSDFAAPFPSGFAACMAIQQRKVTIPAETSCKTGTASASQTHQHLEVSTRHNDVFKWMQRNTNNPTMLE